jgi:DNA-binding transcriptional LysR family regulator
LDVELRHLRYLVAVADAGTFVRAAEVLRVAQPALTRQIHDLEKELDAELFDSAARKATLTTAGQACVRLARHVIQDTERAVTRARLSNSGLAGRCVVCSGPYPIAIGFVATLVGRIKESYPGIELVTTEGVERTLWDAIASGDSDVGLGGAAPKEYRVLSTETQFVHALNTAMMPGEHPLSARAELSVAELSDYRFLALIASDVSSAYNQAAAEIRARGFTGDRIREAHGVDSLLAQLRAGEGWTIVPEPIASKFPPLVGVRLTDIKVPSRVVRMWRRADARPVVHTVLSVLRLMQQEAHEVESARGASIRTHSGTPFVPARLELRHLRSFAKVAKFGSLGRAAESMELTQPALSRQMRDLEHDVGVDLLKRETRGMELTEAGESFLADVHGVLSVADHLRKEVSRARRGTAGECDIGLVPHPDVSHILGMAVKALAGGTPNVMIKTRSLVSPLQTAALQKSEVDVVVGFAFPVPNQASEGLIRQQLFEDEICAALLRADHPLATGESLSLADLQDVPFLFSSRDFFTRFYDTVMQEFALAGFQPRIDATYDRLVTTWSLVGQGLGWTLGWRSQMREPPVGLRAVPLRDFTLGWGAEIIYRRDESRATILAVIDAIIDAAAYKEATAVRAETAVLPAATHTSQAAIP